MNADNNPAPLVDAGAQDSISDSVLVQPIVPMPTLTVGRPIVIPDVWLPPYQLPPTIPVPEGGFETEEDLRAWLIDAIDAQYGELFGTSYTDKYWPWAFYDTVDLSIFGSLSAAPLSSDSSTTRASFAEFSDTNVQVEGVDEADLIETDGKYVYLVTGNELMIIDAEDPENLSIASRIELQDRPTGIYLTGDRLTLISSSDAPADGFESSRLIFTTGLAMYEPVFKNATTTVTVLDLSDRSEPTLVQRTELHGSLVSSRMVDGQFRLVLSHQKFQIPQIQTHSTLNEESGRTEYTYETRDEYLERVLDEMVDSLLPTYRTFSVDGEVTGETRLVEPQELLVQDSLSGFSRTTIATFDVLGDDAGPAATKALFTRGAAEVYSTEDSLYVFAPTSDYYHPETAIWKFDFDAEDHSIKLAAKGQVTGSLLNQFAADEYDGYLRVVTTGGSWSAGHGLYVLEQVGKELKVVGSVDGLAPGEVLYSVRFQGDRAFAVTFHKVDPLFAIDLSDPTNPQVAGELKIPCYSEYLQPIDENHLLAIGRGASETSVWFQELQVSIFDVSDLSDPQLAHRYSFEGGRSTATIATGDRWTQGDGDHHAVAYFPSAEILAIPVYSPDQGGGTLGGVDNTPIFESGKGGLQVFSVDVDAGFVPLALIEHDSPILRSLQIGDALVAFSAGEISTHDITDPATQLDSLQLLVGSDVGLVELTAYVAPVSAPALVSRGSLRSLATSVLAAPAHSVGRFSRAAHSAATTPSFGFSAFAPPQRRTSPVDVAFGRSATASVNRSLEKSTKDFDSLNTTDGFEFEQAVDALFDTTLI